MAKEYRLDKDIDTLADKKSAEQSDVFTDFMIVSKKKQEYQQNKIEQRPK